MTDTDWVPGSFWRLELPDGSYGYARLAESPYVAFVERRTPRPLSDPDEPAGSGRVFVAAVETWCVERWAPLGPDPTGAPVDLPPVRFRQAIGSPGACTIIDAAGATRPAAPAECVGLEPAAVWSPPGVEQRLLDHLLGRPNPDVEALQVRLGQ